MAGSTYRRCDAILSQAPQAVNPAAGAGFNACVNRAFWLRHREAPLNERQRKALNLARSGGELDDGWLTNRRYLKLSGANTPLTASRDLAHLEQLGIIRRDPTTGGRSTRYSVVLSKQPG